MKVHAVARRLEHASEIPERDLEPGYPARTSGITSSAKSWS